MNKSKGLRKGGNEGSELVLVSSGILRKALENGGLTYAIAGEIEQLSLYLVLDAVIQKLLQFPP
jgi:hypothetical protein